MQLASEIQQKSLVKNQPLKNGDYKILPQSIIKKIWEAKVSSRKQAAERNGINNQTKRKNCESKRPKGKIPATKTWSDNSQKAQKHSKNNKEKNGENRRYEAPLHTLKIPPLRIKPF